MSERVLGMEAQGPIPFRAIIAYADEYDLQGYRREAFGRIIRILDNHWLKLEANRMKKERDKASKANSSTSTNSVVETW